jgi:hypothetical protein
MPDTTSMQPFAENDKEMSVPHKSFINEKNRHCRMQTSTTPLHKPKNMQQNLLIVGLIAVGLVMISPPFITKEK